MLIKIKRMLTPIKDFIIKNYSVLKFKNIVLVKYYSGSKNWGDELNVYLIEKITNKKVIRVSSNMYKHILGIGSILANATSNSFVWGSGFIHENQKVIDNPQHVSCCRGLLTGELLESQQVKSPSVFGDPGLLISRYYNPEVKKLYKLGFVPHYIEKEHYFVKYLESLGVKIIDIQQDIEAFADDLLECENIISSSLHGLIASDSYAIPNRWLRLTEAVYGGRFKFDDYHSAIGFEHEPYYPSSDDTVEYLISLCVFKSVNLERLEHDSILKDLINEL